MSQTHQLYCFTARNLKQKPLVIMLDGVVYGPFKKIEIKPAQAGAQRTVGDRPVSLPLMTFLPIP